MPDLINTINAVFPNKTIVVVGDLVADQFLSGTIQRVSREAPVFIMRHDETVTLPGAAANAAANVASLGGRVRLIGTAGTDANGEKLLASLETAGVTTAGVVPSSGSPTTTKVRVLAGQQFAARNQVIRIDYEDPAGPTEEIRAELRSRLADAADGADAIVISDYNYGAVFPEIFDDAVEIGGRKNIPVVVDSRFRLERYAGATSATPNREEVEHILGPNFTDQDCEALRERSGLRSLLVTNGSDGMTLYEADHTSVAIPAVGSLTAVDVTGAGDTVIAAYALGLASGLSFLDAAKMANHAGGVAVMKKRTATVTADELAASIKAHPNPAASQAK